MFIHIATIVLFAAAIDHRPDAAQAMQKQIDPVAYRRVPLVTVLDHYQDVSGVSMSVRWKALHRVGVYSDSPVTLALNEATVASALRETLRNVDRGVGNDGPDFAVRNGVIVVSTKSDLAGDLETRVYEVSDLLAAKLTEREQGELQEAVAALWKQHYQVFSPPWRRQPRRWDREGRSLALRDRSKSPRQRETTDIISQMEEILTARRAAELVTIIRASVDPASWSDDPAGASVSHFNGRLVVRQTPENHARVARLIDDLTGERRGEPPK